MSGDVEKPKPSRLLSTSAAVRSLFAFGTFYLLVAIPAINPDLWPDLWPDLLQRRGSRQTLPNGEPNELFLGLTPQFASLAHVHPRSKNTAHADLKPRFEYRGRSPHLGTDPHSRVPTSLKTAWEFPNFNLGIHGASKASAAVDESGVYLGSDGGWFYAFEHDGRVRWRFHVGDSQRGLHSTAALDERFVYFGSYAGVIYAFEKSTGQLRWAIGDLGVAVGASIRLVGDDLIAAVETFDFPNRKGDGYLIRIRRSDGHVLWKSDWLGEQAHSTPAYDEASGLLIIGANNARLIAIRSSNGQTAWSIPIGGMIKSSPVILGTEVIATTWGKELLGVEIVSGKVLRRLSLAGMSQSSPLVIPELDRAILLSAPGVIYGVSLKSFGIVWEQKIERDHGMASATGVKTPKGEWVAWTACGPDRLCALRPQDGRRLNEIQLNGELSGVPIAFENSLYISLNAPGSLLKLAPKAGQQ